LYSRWDFEARDSCSNEILKQEIHAQQDISMQQISFQQAISK
jgi:hypothetical protein